MFVTINKKVVPGDAFLVDATITFDTYATGGIAILPSDFKLTTIDNVIFSSPLLGHKWTPEYDRTAGKIIVYTAASPPAQLHDGASMAGLTLDVTIIGK